MEETKKERGMCILCRKKRYREKLVPICHSVTLFPLQVKKFRYNVCLDACLDKIHSMKLENSIKIVYSE
jgi:hypothetical protein